MSNPLAWWAAYALTLTLAAIWIYGTKAGTAAADWLAAPDADDHDQEEVNAPESLERPDALVHGNPYERASV